MREKFAIKREEIQTKVALSPSSVVHDLVWDSVQIDDCEFQLLRERIQHLNSESCRNLSVYNREYSPLRLRFRKQHPALFERSKWIGRKNWGEKTNSRMSREYISERSGSSISSINVSMSPSLSWRCASVCLMTLLGVKVRIYSKWQALHIK